MNKPTRWGRWEAQLVPVSNGKKNPPPFTLCPLHPAAPAKSGALKNNGSTFRRKEGEDADNFLRSAEKVLSARDTALGRLCPLERSETRRGGTLLLQPASGLREADSVYTCHEGGGRSRKPERSPKLLHGGREGTPARSSGQVDSEGKGGPQRPGGHGWLSPAEPGMPSAVPLCFRRCQQRSAPAEKSGARAGARRPAPGPTRVGAPGRDD